MRFKFLDKLRGLGNCTSGNATMLVAISLPVLIGGAGLGTDIAQWYMWKRELQYAVDEAALAGAWAKASTQPTVQLTYQARATQEYNANIATVGDFDSGPNVGLADFGTGTNNSVQVTASATRSLPFSSLLVDRSTTVSVSAKATWNASADFHACLLALDPSGSDTFTFGGSVSGTAACGAGAISDAASAMKEVGNTAVPLGTLVSEGGIDSGFADNGTIFQNQTGLSDPYSALSAPNSSGQPSRTYPTTCPVATPASTTYKADGMTWTHYAYKYYKGANSNNWTLQASYTGTGYIKDNWAPVPQANYNGTTGVWTPVAGGSYTNGVVYTSKSVTSTATTGLQAESSAAAGTAVDLGGNGNNKMWRVPYTSTRDKITTIITTTTPAADGIVHLLPGVYTSLAIACTTEFAPGVYHVSGTFDLGQNQTVTGTGGVMFVLTGASGGIHVNSNSNVTLAGITATTLINSYGYTADDAAKLAGMLVWDPNSTAAFQLNGNSTLHLSGIMYMPKRDATFNGNSSAAGNCIMVATKTIKINGNFNLSNFCVSTGGSAMSIGGTAASVKLVA